MKTLETWGNKSIDRLPKKYQDRIDSISDERNNGDGFWIYLKDGWLWDNEVAIVHEQTISNAIEGLKHRTNKTN